MAARKKDDEQVSMIGSFRDFQDTKNIDRTTLVSVLEESFRNVLVKIYGSDENFDVIVNPDKGDFEIYRNRVVVANGDVTKIKRLACRTHRKLSPTMKLAKMFRRRLILRNLAAVLSLPCARRWQVRY